MLVLGVVTALALVLVGALEVARAISLAHQARGAADLVALAAASAALVGTSGVDACSAGARVAAANGAQLTTCRLEMDGTVWVAVTVTSSRPWTRTATGVARAGPP